MDLTTLREKHPVFIYHSYQYQVTAEGLAMTWQFSLDSDITFQPKLLLAGVTKTEITGISPPELDNLVFHLGLMEIPSYWKATCSPEIRIKAGSLTDKQVTWWKKLLLHGLGEFFFRNEIDFTGEDFVTINTPQSRLHRDDAPLTKRGLPSHVNKDNNRPSNIEPRKVLVPIGGGKDSIVTWELLRQSDFEVIPFALNPIVATQELLKLTPEIEPIIVKRTIDPKLLELNQRGYLNGHTPFSAYLAFTTYAVASLYQIPYIALSNERSASEGNVEYLGQEVNHQYSKSFEFEQDFRQYASRWLAIGDTPADSTSVASPLPPAPSLLSPSYFSFLRPLHELQIAQLFSQLITDNWSLATIFRSCNVGQKTNSWCGECSKCLFAFIMLFPFLDFEVEKIFGSNLLEKESLLEEALNLIHPERIKPWECVGTRDESQVAFWLSVKKYEEAGRPLPFILENIQNDLAQVTERDAQRLLQDWNSEHNLPTEFAEILERQELRMKKPEKVILDNG